MVKKKEDRSHWVAVQPESKAATDNAPPPIKPARSAYQFFQKENSSSIHQELNNSSASGSGSAVDVGTLGREVSSRWQSLPSAERRKYEELAEKDKFRFLSESHKRDVEALERKERLQKERETLILEDDGDDDDYQGGGRRATRRTRRKRERKAEKKRAKKEQKKKAKKAASKVTKVAAARKTKDDDDDSDYESDSSEDAESSSYEDESSEDDDSSASSSSSSSSDSSKKKKPAKRSPAKVSQAVLDRRTQARKEKLQKEQYIEQRQSDVRSERAEQAKRRLEFLLKQSDIFSHFGNVKQEKARLGLSSSVAATTTSLEKGDGKDCKTIVRKPSSSSAAGGGSNGDMKEVDEEERQEVDEHEATYLTAQPSTLRGKMRQYQLEGLNVS